MPVEQTNENNDSAKGQNDGVRGFEIRTMEKDLRDLTGEESAIPVGRKMPERSSGSRGARPRFSERIRLSKKYVAPMVIFLVLFIIGGSVFGIIALVKQGGSPPPSPSMYHSVCKDNQCQLIKGEGENECTKDKDCGSITREATILVPGALEETLAITPFTRERFLSILEDTLADDRPEYSIRALTLKIVEDNAPRTLVEFTNATEILGVSIPPAILSRVETYTLLLYTAGQREKDRCAQDNITNPQCRGARIGLALKIDAEGRESLLSNLRSWEPTMLNDLKSLILAPANETAPEFQDFMYRDIAIRYKNLEISTVTVNYAVVNDLLIIGTSKNTIFSILDLLRP